MEQKKVSKKWVIIWTVIILVFIAGVVSVIQGAGSFFHTIASGHHQPPAKLTVVKDANAATFSFLVPAASNDWQFNPTSPRFDATEGVVDYQVKLMGNDVIISQQPMPANLAPANTSPKFNQFIVASNVILSEKAGTGEVYFRQSNTTGAATSGAVTVIFATNDILMFGQASGPIPYKTWVEFFSALQPVK